MVKLIKKKKKAGSLVRRSDCYDLNGLMGEAIRCHQSGKLDDAEVLYRRIIENDSGDAGISGAHNNLANILKARDNVSEAIEHYQKAISLNPGIAETHYNLGSSFYRLGNFDKSIQQYMKAISIKPSFAEAYSDLGNSLKMLGKFKEAVEKYQEAISIKPDLAVAYNNLGDAYKELGLYEKAVEQCQKAVELMPDSGEVHVNLGNVLLKQGEIQDSILHYQKAIDMAPDYADAHYNKSLALLLTGNFDEGWKEYEWRFRSGEIALDIGFKDSGLPVWDGSCLEDKTIIIQSEQGAGDSVQFARYIPIVRSRCKKVIFECDKSLLRLFKGCDGVDTIVEKPFAQDDNEVPDVSVPLMSLPGMFKTNISTISSDVPYIKVAPEIITKWKSIISSELFKVGIVWAGSPDHKNDRNRSCSLTDFAPLLNVPGVDYYSLQKGNGSEHLSDPSIGINIMDLGNKLDDYYDTAAAIMNLDLVISVDTSAVHLAGALGKSVWTLLPYSPDWRWMLDRHDSPWYPTMRLFRQTGSGDWQGVFELVAEELKQIIEGSVITDKY